MTIVSTADTAVNPSNEALARVEEAIDVAMASLAAAEKVVVASLRSAGRRVAKLPRADDCSSSSSSSSSMVHIVEQLSAGGELLRRFTMCLDHPSIPAPHPVHTAKVGDQWTWQITEEEPRVYYRYAGRFERIWRMPSSGKTAFVIFAEVPAT